VSGPLRKIVPTAKPRAVPRQAVSSCPNVLSRLDFGPPDSKAESEVALAAGEHERRSERAAYVAASG
jgi:hypothetical protein